MTTISDSTAVIGTLDPTGALPAVATLITDVLVTSTKSGYAITLTGTTQANSSVSLFDTQGVRVLSDITADAAGGWTATLSQNQDVSHAFSAAAVTPLGSVVPSGNQALLGTMGNDVIYAVGTGDIVEGLGGYNSLTAAPTVDYFVFHPKFGSNSISNFDVQHDVLEFDRSLAPNKVTTDAQLEAWILTKAEEVNGTTSIRINAHETITLAGVLESALSTANFHLI